MAAGRPFRPCLATRCGTMPCDALPCTAAASHGGSCPAACVGASDLNRGVCRSPDRSLPCRAQPSDAGPSTGVPCPSSRGSLGLEPRCVPLSRPSLSSRAGHCLALPHRAPPCLAWALGTRTRVCATRPPPCLASPGGDSPRGELPYHALPHHDRPSQAWASRTRTGMYAVRPPSLSCHAATCHTAPLPALPGRARP
jgi:hypothetical protein